MGLSCVAGYAKAKVLTEKSLSLLSLPISPLFLSLPLLSLTDFLFFNIYVCVCVRPYADRSNNSLGCCNPLGHVGAARHSCCGLMDMASHVNDADDNVDAADDDVYAGYVFISVTAGSNFLLPPGHCLYLLLLLLLLFFWLLVRPASSAAYA